MIQDKKVGDTVYVQYTDPLISARTETVETVGRVFIKTIQGNQFNKHTGAERKPNLRRDFKPTCKAWPSKEIYVQALAHHVQFIETVKAMRELKPSDITFDELNVIAAIINRTKKG